MTAISPTQEQSLFVNHKVEVFVEACPGSGKTQTIIARLARIVNLLPPRKGVAVLSFTNSAVDEFIKRCNYAELGTIQKFPNFIGTFDSFVRQFLILPSGIDGVSVQPTIIDSWDTLGIEIRLKNERAFRGKGVSLDKFDPKTNEINPDTIGHNGLKNHVCKYKNSYVQSATQWRKHLRNKGYLSANDARVELLYKLKDKTFASCLGKAISARFYEMIVDEAQDCNPDDLNILEWLRTFSLPVTIVCDPDQAIYGFRHGELVNLLKFADNYDNSNRLNMTGNFRSSPPICSLASTLRKRKKPDDSVGENKDITHPIHILVYQGITVPCSVGIHFYRIVQQNNINSKEAIILAHTWKAAERASGLSSSDSTGTSKVEAIARVVSEFWAPSATNRVHEKSVQKVEKMILEMMGMIEPNEHPTRAVERHNIDKRWLRRIAFDFLTHIPKTCSNTDEERSRWIYNLHSEVNRLNITFSSGKSARSYFRTPPKSEWSKLLQHCNTEDIPYSTIHEAKGRQYEAVCIVIPPDRAPENRTSHLFDVWEKRTDDEAKRVIYVGVTRTKKLLVMAIHANIQTRLINLLSGNNVPYQVHILT